jgi:hypothetical protein
LLVRSLRDAFLIVIAEARHKIAHGRSGTCRARASAFRLGQIGANIAKFFRAADQRSPPPLLLCYGLRLIAQRLAPRSLGIIGYFR